MECRLFGVWLTIALGFLLVNCSFMSQDGLSLICNSMRFGESTWSKCALPIYVCKDEIIFGSIPKAEFKIIDVLKQTSDDKRDFSYRCKNSKGTVFTVKLEFSSKYVAVMTVENQGNKMEYECSISNEKPYYNMVDLGLSCKWGLSNYYNYSTDIVSATYGAGKRLTYDEAYKLFGSGEHHLPSTKQINELLTRCSWEFIDNPDNGFRKGFLVTGPNGNSIFFPCNDGGDGNFSSAWYLGSEEFDTYLVNALQLNADNRIVYPFEKHYYGNIRLVEDK